MSNFVKDCINGDAILEQIDDYLSEWHETNTSLSVFEYLGMTKDEYFLWVENDCILKYIIKAHEINQDVKTIIKEEKQSGVKMVARAGNPEEAKALYKWLKDTKRID